MLLWQMQSPFSKSKLPVLLRCMHSVCIDCIIEIRENQKGEKLISITCKECGEVEDLELQYHNHYHDIIIQSQKD